jgi:hypothetical protein
MVDVSVLIGMGKRQSQNKAESMNLIYRLIRVDGETIQSYPDDVRDDRVCVEIDGGKVTKATIQ